MKEIIATWNDLSKGIKRLVYLTTIFVFIVSAKEFYINYNKCRIKKIFSCQISEREKILTDYLYFDIYFFFKDCFVPEIKNFNPLLVWILFVLISVWVYSGFKKD